MTAVRGPTPPRSRPSPASSSTGTAWRGRFDEDQTDDLPIDENLPLRREARGLLWSLLRPYRATVAVLALVVVVENAARLSVPLLVQRGIDHGIPPIIDGGSAHTLLTIVGALAVVVLVQASSRMFFLRRSGRIGQKVLLELRRRVFRHFQRLDIAFHERYTSGRVVSRSTNDVEAIQDMLETGFDSLITAVLTLIGTSILLGDAGCSAGPDVSGRLPRAGGAGLVVPRRVGQGLSQGARECRAGDRAVRRDHDRHQGGAGIPARGAEPGDLRGHRRRLPGDQREDLPAARRLHARGQTGRQHHHWRGAALRRLPGAQRADDHRHTRGVPAVPADVLRTDAGDLAVLQHLPVRLVGAGEAGGGAGPALGDQGSAAARRNDDGARRHRLPRRAVLVRRRPSGTAGSRFPGACGSDGGAGRHHGRRQDDDRETHCALL